MPKTAKTIFHTTEKSNFILNMKPEAYYQYNLKILSGFLLLMPLFSVVLEFAKVYSVPAMALSITGVLAMVFVFIGFMKSETPRHLFLPAGILGAMLIWGLVSLFNASYPAVALLGEDGRNEGWLASLFYFCFFLLAAQLGTDKNHMKLLNGMCIMGLVECAWALLQILPINFPSYYKNLEPLLLFRVYLPSGLTGSPIFLAMLLSVLLIPAMLGTIFTEEKQWRIWYGICCFCFVLFSVRTQCLLGVCAPAAAVVIACIYGFAKKANKKTLLCLLLVLAAAAAGAGLVYIAPSVSQTYTYIEREETPVENQFALYDGGIIWEDSAYRLAASGYYVRSGAKHPSGEFDISSIPETYQFMADCTKQAIRLFPLTGSGQDGLAYIQRYQNEEIASNPNTFDRCYNYYLHLAATTGIPMLILFLILVILVIRNGLIRCRKSSGTPAGWVQFAFLGAVIVYLLLLLLGTSCITVTPLFWMLAGVCMSQPE